ncbi:hypothetical protein C8R45DRAFT_940905 [Mycena sanguinolenta]|nr:hypothetical protein C8R45DRAFT_940905 [Mycena sanguinolenta]
MGCTPLLTPHSLAMQTQRPRLAAFHSQRNLCHPSQCQGAQPHDSVLSRAGTEPQTTEIRAGTARRMAGGRASPREETGRATAMVMGEDNVGEVCQLAIAELQ